MTTTALPPAVTSEREAALLASVPTGLLIGGEWVEASDGGTFEVHDPATGQVLATLASATSDDALAALDAADAVQASQRAHVAVPVLRGRPRLVLQGAEAFGFISGHRR